jgi:hypothetical protein
MALVWFEFSTNVVTLPAASTLRMLFVLLTSMLPSAMPTGPSVRCSPALTSSIFVPAATTPGMAVAVKLSGGGGCC